MSICKPRHLAFLLPLALTLGGCGGGGASGAATPSLTLPAASVSEGDSATTDLVFTISLDAVAAATVTVDYETADSTAGAGDYTASSGQLSIPAGATSASITIGVNGDTTVETDEEFTVALSNPVNATIANGVGVGTIVNDDFPMLSIAAGPAVAEGDTGTMPLTFDITLDQAAIGDVSVDYASSDVVATAGDDYEAVSGTVTIAEGDTATSIEVTINGDTDIEVDEQFVVNLLNPSSNARILDDEATGQIINDDYPKLRLQSASVTEVDDGTRALTLPLTLDAAATADLVVAFETADGTAHAGSDYNTTTGSVVIPAGDTSTSIGIDTVGDTVAENSEAFEVRLIDLQGPAEIEIGTARATILDNDGPPAGPQLFGMSAAVVEGDGGTTSLSFLVLLDQALQQPVSFDYETIDGSATSVDDYAPASGTATIAAGEREVIVDVTVSGDTAEEGDEDLMLSIDNASGGVAIITPHLSGTIIDDDATEPQTPLLSIASAALTEGDAGTTDMIFDVTLNRAATNVVSVDYASEEDTATADIDYASVSGTLTFQVGETSRSIAVPIIGDTFSEDNERFRVRLSNLSGDAAFGIRLATGTIVTDEPVARVSVSDASRLEGDSGTSSLEFFVTLSVATVDAVTFDYATSDGTALAGEDYVAVSGSAQILPGDTRVTVPVSINGDPDNEPDEEFTLTLSNLSLNATFDDATATGTLTNDDASPGWQTPQVLGRGWEPDVDMASDGNGAAIWNTDTDPLLIDDAIEAAVFTAGSWQASTKLADVANVSRDPVIAANGNGNAVALWQDGSVDWQTSIYTAGSGWATSNLQGPGGWDPQIAGNDLGGAIAVWEETTGVGVSFTNVWRATLDAGTGTWNGAEQVEFDDTGHANQPFVDIDDAGNAIVVWKQSFANSSLSGIYYDYFDASTGAWTSAMQIPSTLFSDPKDVDLLPGGGAVLVVRARGFANDGDSTEALLYDPATQTWTVSGPVETFSTEDSVEGKSAVDGSGNIFVAWFVENSSSGVWDVYANRYDAAANAWSGPVSLENAAGTANPGDGGLDIGADGAGNAIVVWSQNVGTAPATKFRIRAARYSMSNGGWGPAEQIDDENGGTSAVEPNIGVDDAGNAIAVWEYAPEREIGSNRYLVP